LGAVEYPWVLGSLSNHYTDYLQFWWFTNLLLCDMPWNKAPLTGTSHIWCGSKPCPCSDHELNKDSSRVCWILLVNVCYGSCWAA